MKKIIVTIILTATTLTAAQPAAEVPRLDVMTGNYYGYMVRTAHDVEKEDGKHENKGQHIHDGRNRRSR